ncbi:phosphoribosylamine--glycine ligase [uncultured Pseudokineococcus sp.]|uniref:phosphoribosylamine--glycine ligase n=1 Tax=uncultured Pseudokineococcus sp. TaxID=1642928 RepID=UPI002634DF39|nr:phosphoribosylamine--glycine ligase [uncultured Pseudokineococcus sp.]
MRVLVVGSGAREHALAVALAADDDVSDVLVGPGGPGVADVAEVVPLDPLDGAAVAALARERGVDLVVVGPEAPLVGGVADAVRAAGVDCFGPSAVAARLEGSKAFAKDVMASADVPTAMARVCTDVDQVAAALDAFGAPHVVKDDGLAGGKGVVVTSDREEALAHARSCLEGRPGAGASAVVVEEFLDGPEVSLFVLCDGRDVVPLAPAQDSKRLRDGDEGPNTGGMGAYSPLPWAPEGLVDEVVERVAQPVVDEMARRGTPFAGVLYCGLALTSRGVRVVEFNARFGDPETQVVLPRLRTPLGGLLRAAATGRLAEAAPLGWSSDAAVVVVLAAGGYPAAPRAGDPLSGLEAAAAVPGARVLHAGTAAGADGALVASGGRVLSLVGTGATLADARAAAYAAVAEVGLQGGQHRTDIAAASAALAEEVGA